MAYPHDAVAHWQQTHYNEDDPRLIAHIRFDDYYWTEAFPKGAEDVRWSIKRAGFELPVGVKILLDRAGYVKMSGFVKFRTIADATTFCQRAQAGIFLNGKWCIAEPHAAVGTFKQGQPEGTQPLLEDVDPHWVQDGRTVCIRDLPAASIVSRTNFRNELTVARIPAHSIKLVKVPNNGPYKPYAFVTLHDETSAQWYLKAGRMHLYGRDVTVGPPKAPPAEIGAAPEQQRGFPFPENNTNPPWTPVPPPATTAPGRQQLEARPGGDRTKSLPSSDESRRTVVFLNIPCLKSTPAEKRIVNEREFQVAWRREAFPLLPEPQRVEFLVDEATAQPNGRANAIMTTEHDARLLLERGTVKLNGIAVQVSSFEPPRAALHPNAPAALAKQSPPQEFSKPTASSYPSSQKESPTTYNLAPVSQLRPESTHDAGTVKSSSWGLQGLNFAPNVRIVSPAVNSHHSAPTAATLSGHRPLELDLRSSPVLRRREVELTPFPPQGAPTFSVLTWNILFQFYTNSHTDYCPEKQLAWSWRVQQLEKIIRYSDADVVALQEVVDGSEWAELEKILKGLGYESRRLGKYVYGKPNVDGLSLSFKASVFDVAPSGDELRIRLHPTEPQAGLAVCATHRQSGQRVVFATTHLKAPKLEEEVRQVQIETFLTEIGSRWFPHGPEQRNVPSLILCGDFNSQPHWGLVSRLKQPNNQLVGELGEVYLDAPREKAFEGKQYTCFMPFTQDQLDYIFYSKRELQPVSLWQVPSDLEVVKLYQEDKRTYGRAPVPPGGVPREFEMLPTPSFPSDHLPLFARFAMNSTAAPSNTAPPQSQLESAPTPCDERLPSDDRQKSVVDPPPTTAATAKERHRSGEEPADLTNTPTPITAQYPAADPETHQPDTSSATLPSSPGEGQSQTIRCIMHFPSHSQTAAPGVVDHHVGDTSQPTQPQPALESERYATDVPLRHYSGGGHSNLTAPAPGVAAPLPLQPQEPQSISAFPAAGTPPWQPPGGYYRGDGMNRPLMGAAPHRSPGESGWHPVPPASATAMGGELVPPPTVRPYTGLDPAPSEPIQPQPLQGSEYDNCDLSPE